MPLDTKVENEEDIEDLVELDDGNDVEDGEGQYDEDEEESKRFDEDGCGATSEGLETFTIDTVIRDA